MANQLGLQSSMLDSIFCVTEYQITNLQLKQGVEYFTQVRACNSAHLCTVVTSDGLVIDASPPYLGPVFDGLFDADVDYQAKK